MCALFFFLFLFFFFLTFFKTFSSFFSFCWIAIIFKKISRKKHETIVSQQKYQHGGAGGIVVVHSPCTNGSGVQFPLRAVCANGFQSMFALAGFLRALRFPPAFKIGTLYCVLCLCLDPFGNKSHDFKDYPWCMPN